CTARSQTPGIPVTGSGRWAFIRFLANSTNLRTRLDSTSDLNGIPSRLSTSARRPARIPAPSCNGKRSRCKKSNGSSYLISAQPQRLATERPRTSRGDSLSVAHHRAATLHQHRIAPAPIHAADSLAGPDHSEPGLPAHRKACRVFRKDAGLQRPDSFALGGLDHGC